MLNFEGKKWRKLVGMEEIFCHKIANELSNNEKIEKITLNNSLWNLQTTY